MITPRTWKPGNLKPWHNAHRFCCVGMGGTGKTTKAYDILLRSAYDYYFVFDHDGQFSLRHGLKACTTRAQIIAELKRSGFVVYDPRPEYFAKLNASAAMKERDQMRIFHRIAVWFCRYVFEMALYLPGQSMFFCDELQKLCQFYNPWLAAILEEGRNRALDFGCCTLHLGKIDIAVRNQFTRRYVFKIEEQTAADYLAQLGFNRSEVLALPKFHFIERDSHEGTFTRGHL